MLEDTTFAAGAAVADEFLVESSIGENKDFTAVVLEPDDVEVDVEDEDPELLL